MASRSAIVAGTIVPMNMPPINEAAVIIKKGIIERIVSRKDIPSDCKVEEYPESILLPAFVNAHTHLVYTSFKGLADDTDFFEWLTGSIIPLDMESRKDECLLSAREGVKQSFRHGITATGENHYLQFGKMAMSELGMKGVFFFEIFGTRTLNLTRSLKENEQYIEHHAREATERILSGIAPHAPYSVPPSMARMAARAASRLSLPLSIHAAETSDETDLFMFGKGKLAAIKRTVRLPAPDRSRTPLRYLDECGLLNKRTILIHGIHFSDDDINLVSSRGCTLVTCPTSNAKLGCGIARVGCWISRGIPVCIATDSPASGESFDLFEEMRRFVLFQRALTSETSTFNAEDVFRMVTVNPAKALGLSHLVGDLREGSAADMILAVPEDRGLRSNRNIYQTLLWGTYSHNIKVVYADGVEVYNCL